MRTRYYLCIPRRLPLLVGCGLMLALAACDASTLSGPAAHATATAQAQTAATTATAAAQATRAAQPVLLATQVVQQGTLAAGNAHLIVTLTVTNQTDQTIQLTSPGCRVPALVFEIHASKQTLWASWIVESCPVSMPHDEQALAAGSAYTTTINGNLAYITRLGMPKLQAGVPYTIQGKLWIWHQGTLDQYMNQSERLSGNDLTTSLPFTLR